MTALPGQVPLKEHDPVLFDLIEQEKRRQWAGLEMVCLVSLSVVRIEDAKMAWNSIV